MKEAARKIALIAILACSTLACGDTPVATMENPAEDSALALSIMSARGDTLGAAVENVIVNEPLPERLDVAPPPSPPPVKAVIKPAPALVLPPARVVASPRPRKPTRIATVPEPQVTLEPPVVPERRVIEEPPPAPEPVERRERVEPPARLGTIASRATLALSTTGRVCNAMEVGRTFRAETVQSIRGSNDLVIPAGARATAEVTSVSKWGAGVGVQVTSVRFRGASYPVSTRVAYVLPEGEAACIPAGTSFEVKTR
jgi:hypothetical protein